MGIFSGLGGDNTLDKLLRAQSIMHGDYGAAAHINRGIRTDKRAKESAEGEQQRRQQVFEALVKQGVPPEQATVMMQNLDATGKAQSEMWGERGKVRQFGAEGGSISAPNVQGGYDTTHIAPSWQNGSLFGAGQSGATPQILIEAEKAIPVEQGGAVAGLKPYSGQTRPIIGPNMGQGQFGAPMGGGVPPTPSVPSGSPFVSQPSGPPPQALDYLRTHPETWEAFEQKYGPGSARAALGVR